MDSKTAEEVASLASSLQDRPAADNSTSLTKLSL